MLGTLGTTVDGQPFVPGLYRMLASWPAFLAHVATVLRPHLADTATRAACQRLLDSVGWHGVAMEFKVTPAAPPYLIEVKVYP